MSVLRVHIWSSFQHSGSFLGLHKEFHVPKECDCLGRELETPGKSALGECALATRRETIVTTLTEAVLCQVGLLTHESVSQRRELRHRGLHELPTPKQESALTFNLGAAWTPHRSSTWLRAAFGPQRAVLPVLVSFLRRPPPVRAWPYPSLRCHTALTLCQFMVL